jgi:hypothetical protein
MTTILNWHNESIEVARSSGGVLAAVNPWQNVISTGVRPWPAPELIQKIYQSRQVRAFSGEEHRLATATLGFTRICSRFTAKTRSRGASSAP